MTLRVEPKFVVTYDSCTINIYHANKGEGIPKHEHNYAHLTMCHSGSCYIRKENKEVVIVKETQPINLIAHEWHEIEAAEDGTVFVNLFSHIK
jgi:quercetin dioxygenase-like cupin family protein